MRRPNARPPMLHRLIANTKLPQIEPHHLRLDLHLIELLPAIDANDTANHLRHDDHVPEVGLHEIRFLVGFGFLLGFAEFLDQAHGFAFEAAVEAAAGAGVDDVPELFGGEVEESGEAGLVGGGERGEGEGEGDVLVEVDAAVREFAEGSLLLELCSVASPVSDGLPDNGIYCYHGSDSVETMCWVYVPAASSAFYAG